MADELLGAVWRKSRRSGDTTAQCVEIAIGPDAVGLRDSKDREGTVLIVSREAAAEFLAGVKAGEFDRP